MTRFGRWMAVGMAAAVLGGCAGTPLAFLPDPQALRTLGTPSDEDRGKTAPQRIEETVTQTLRKIRRSLPNSTERQFAGQWLTQSDWEMLQSRTAIAMERAVDGDRRTWTNLETGLSAMVRPTRTYQRSDGVTCRDFRLTLAGPDDVTATDGMACRRADGTWSVMATEIQPS